MAVTLLVDAGNTRAKWSLERDGAVTAQGSITHRDTPGWARDLALRRRPDAIWVGNVAGARFQSDLDAWTRAGDLPEPHYVAVRRECLGLRVAYDDESHLGVDRFLALLGARARHGGALCVADVGTAVTLDGVAADGAHLGGLIAPGPHTMAASLLSGTAQIGAAHGSGPASPFACDTGPAVSAGAHFAVAALIDRFADETAARLGERATLLVTGGGRFEVLPLMRADCREEPDLVLHGLRTLACHAST